MAGAKVFAVDVITGLEETDQCPSEPITQEISLALQPKVAATNCICNRRRAMVIEHEPTPTSRKATGRMDG